MNDSVVLWFTGLSGSGKSTLAASLKRTIESRGKTVLLLDGDAVRETVHRHLSFTPTDIVENNERLAMMSKESMKKADMVIVSAISPFRRSRKSARELLHPHFIEIYVKASLDICIQRDVKGLYKRALAGEIPNFIGVSPDTPYEEPLNAEIVIDTERLTAQESLLKLVFDLEQRKIL